MVTRQGQKGNISCKLVLGANMPTVHYAIDSTDTYTELELSANLILLATKADIKKTSKERVNPYQETNTSIL